MTTDTLYDNPLHWTSMHKKFGGSLKSVGRSGLSETYNRYKYRSEEATFFEAVNKLIFDKKDINEAIKILDVGAGTGYWLAVVQNILTQKKLDLQLHALDLSEDALQVLKKNIPESICIHDNAGTIVPEKYAGKFDLVISNYCLHHITQPLQFHNALNLVIKSVKPGGYLLIMDCFIDREYAPSYNINPETFTGSGYSRPLHLLNEACQQNNMSMIAQYDPISYLMNNVLEDNSYIGFQIKSMIWKFLHCLYKTEAISRFILPIIFPLDKFLKSKRKGFSTRLFVYQKKHS